MTDRFLGLSAHAREMAMREMALQMALSTASPGEAYPSILERAKAFAEYMKPSPPPLAKEYVDHGDGVEVVFTNLAGETLRVD